MSTAMFQVTAECAYVTVDTPTGRSKTLLYKGATFPASAPERAHLEAGNMCAPFGTDDEVGLNAEGTLGPAETDSTQVGSVVASVVAAPDVDPAEAKRAEARAKLPADGSPPHGNASHETWVEYAVVKGMDRGEAEKASRDDLRDALKP